MSSTNDEIPSTAQDDSYVSRQGSKNEEIPVQADSDIVEEGIDPNTADSDAQLERDDKEAIDQSNIVEGKTRGAKPATSYREPGDDEGLPTDE